MSLLTKILLFPFAILYGFVIWLRNWMYKTNFIGSTDFEIPVITVGNLSVGGTGKTPMVELLIEMLRTQFPVAVLSRGYKRKTSGYLSVKRTHTTKEVGDEPLMLKLKYPDVQVSVGEQRVFAIPRLLAEHPEIKVILLDDAFQHQSVRPDINILLTTYSNPFYDDQILPLGTLREFSSGKERANIIVVTKCPENLNEQEQLEIVRKIKPSDSQKVFFSSIEYGLPYNILQPDDRLRLDEKEDTLLITGIANPAPLKDYLEEKSGGVVYVKFEDHHHFEQYELERIRKNYPSFNRWVTTEKDGVRLAAHRDWLTANRIALYCVPIRTKMIGKHAEEFATAVRGYLDYFYRNEQEEVQQPEEDTEHHE